MTQFGRVENVNFRMSQRLKALACCNQTGLNREKIFLDDIRTKTTDVGEFCEFM